MRFKDEWGKNGASHGLELVISDSQSESQTTRPRKHEAPTQTHIHTCTFLWEADKDGSDIPKLFGLCHKAMAVSFKL